MYLIDGLALARTIVLERAMKRAAGTPFPATSAITSPLLALRPGNEIIEVSAYFHRRFGHGRNLKVRDHRSLLGDESF